MYIFFSSHLFWKRCQGTVITLSLPVWCYPAKTLKLCMTSSIIEDILFELGLFNPFPNKPWFLRVCSRSLLKTVLEKEKLLVMNNFSFSYSVFYAFRERNAIFIQFEIVVFKLFQFGSV